MVDKKEMDEIRKAAKLKAKSEAAKKAMPAALQKPSASATGSAARAQEYEVQAGDSLSKIALEVYGDASRWKEIFEANQATIKDPNLIRVGQKLIIP